MTVTTTENAAPSEETTTVVAMTAHWEDQGPRFELDEHVGSDVFRVLAKFLHRGTDVSKARRGSFWYIQKSQGMVYDDQVTPRVQDAMNKTLSLYGGDLRVAIKDQVYPNCPQPGETELPFALDDIGTVVKDETGETFTGHEYDFDLVKHHMATISSTVKDELIAADRAGVFSQVGRTWKVQKSGSGLNVTCHGLTDEDEQIVHKVINRYNKFHTPAGDKNQQQAFFVNVWKH